jgi:hypothetical protein
MVAGNGDDGFIGSACRAIEEYNKSLAFDSIARLKIEHHLFRRFMKIDGNKTHMLAYMPFSMKKSDSALDFFGSQRF